MKFRFFSAFAAVAAIFAFNSCTPEEDFGDPLVELGQAALEFDAAGGSATVALTATLDWTIDGYTDDVKAWLTITPDHGTPAKGAQTITIKAAPNTGLNRTVTLDFKANVLNHSVLTVSQKGEKGETLTATVAEFLKNKDTENEYLLTGKVGVISNSEKYYGFYLKDATGEVCCPFPKEWTTKWGSLIHTGDQVSIKGKYEYYETKSQDQLADGVITIHTPLATTDIQTITVKDFLAKADPYTLYRLQGKVDSSVDATYYSFTLRDDTGSVKVYTVNIDDKAKSVKKGGTVTLRGAYQLYTSGTTSTPEVVDATIESFEEGAATDYSKFTMKTVSEFIAAANKTEYFRLKGTVSNFKSSYCSFDLTDATGKIYVYSVDEETKTNWKDKVKDGGTVEIAGVYDFFTTKSQHEVVDAHIISYEAGTVITSTVEGLVVAVSASAFLIKTDSGYAYAYGTSTVKVGDKVKVTGTSVEYNGVPEIKDFEVSVVSSGNAVEHPSATVLDATKFDALTITDLWKYYSVRGKLTISGTHYNVKVDGASHIGSIVAPADGDVDAIKALDGQYVDLCGYYTGPTVSGSITYENILITSVAKSGNQTEPDKPGQTLMDLKTGETSYADLTNEQICASLALTNETGNTYKDVSFAAAEGKWMGNVCAKSTLKYIQMRNNNASYLTSPTFTKSVCRVVFLIDETTIEGRSVYAMPKVDPASLPTGKGSDNKNILYDEKTFASAYGSVSPAGRKAEYVELNVSADAVKEFSILVGGGATYIGSIRVFFKD